MIYESVLFLSLKNDGQICDERTRTDPQYTNNFQRTINPSKIVDTYIGEGLFCHLHVSFHSNRLITKHHQTNEHIESKKVTNQSRASIKSFSLLDVEEEKIYNQTETAVYRTDLSSGLYHYSTTILSLPGAK